MQIRYTFDPSRPNAVADLTCVGDMPALTGSEKQIAWATEIRCAVARELALTICKIIGIKPSSMVLADREDDMAFVAAEHAKMDAVLTQGDGAKITAALDAIFAEPSAKWWIENSSTHVKTLVRDALAAAK